MSYSGTGTAACLDVAFVSRDDGVHQPIPVAGFPPSIEAVIERRALPVALRRVGAKRTGTKHPENPVQDFSIVGAFNPAHLVGQIQLDRFPFRIRQIVTSHRQAPVSKLDPT